MVILVQPCVLWTSKIGCNLNLILAILKANTPYFESSVDPDELTSGNLSFFKYYRRISGTMDSLGLLKGTATLMISMFYQKELYEL